MYGVCRLADNLPQGARLVTQDAAGALADDEL